MAYRFGDCELDPGLHELRSKGRVSAIEPKVFDLLLYLIENRDRLVGKDELNQRIWNGRFVSDASLSTCIKLARQAIGDSGKRQDYIRTVPRRGFRFVGRVEVRGPSHRASSPAVTDRDTDTVGLTQPGKPSVAVLPFQNMSDDPEQEYFADGIAEDIVTSLSKLSQLLVIARNVGFAHKERAVTVQSIAEELGVRYALEGSVRKAGKRVRISAQLIDCITGRHLWAERYDRELTDIFTVQDEVAQKIVSAMAMTLSADCQRLPEHEATENLPMIYGTRNHVAPNSPPNIVIWSDEREVGLAKFTDSLITHGLILLGLVLMLTPLALWVAWTETIFLGVLATGAAALVLYGVLERFERPADPAQRESSDYVRAKVLPAKSIADLQKLHPFIHHHRPAGSPKFQIAMGNLKKSLS
jgi:TolB-like protein